MLERAEYRRSCKSTVHLKLMTLGNPTTPILRLLSIHERGTPMQDYGYQDSQDSKNICSSLTQKGRAPLSVSLHCVRSIRCRGKMSRKARSNHMHRWLLLIMHDLQATTRTPCPPKKVFPSSPVVQPPHKNMQDQLDEDGRDPSEVIGEKWKDLTLSQLWSCLAACSVLIGLIQGCPVRSACRSLMPSRPCHQVMKRLATKQRVWMDGCAVGSLDSVGWPTPQLYKTIKRPTSPSPHALSM